MDDLDAGRLHRKETLEKWLAEECREQVNQLESFTELHYNQLRHKGFTFIHTRLRNYFVRVFPAIDNFPTTVLLYGEKLNRPHYYEQIDEYELGEK